MSDMIIQQDIVSISMVNKIIGTINIIHNVYSGHCMVTMMCVSIQSNAVVMIVLSAFNITTLNDDDSITLYDELTSLSLSKSIQRPL